MLVYDMQKYETLFQKKEPWKHFLSTPRKLEIRPIILWLVKQWLMDQLFNLKGRERKRNYLVSGFYDSYDKFILSRLENLLEILDTGSAP